MTDEELTEINAIRLRLDELVARHYANGPRSLNNGKLERPAAPRPEAERRRDGEGDQ